jgi:hypothetical protein
MSLPNASAVGVHGVEKPGSFNFNRVMEAETAGSQGKQ